MINPFYIHVFKVILSYIFFSLPAVTLLITEVSTSSILQSLSRKKRTATARISDLPWPKIKLRHACNITHPTAISPRKTNLSSRITLGISIYSDTSEYFPRGYLSFHVTFFDISRTISIFTWAYVSTGVKEHPSAWNIN